MNIRIHESLARLIDDEPVAPDELRALVQARLETLVAAADEAGEPADYMLERLLETCCHQVTMVLDLEGRVANFWLQVDHIPGGSCFEVVVRAAEFLAACHKSRGVDHTLLTTMAHHDDWRQRLVCAWVVRDGQDVHSAELRQHLASDPFEDDNGIFLVREGAGHYD